MRLNRLALCAALLAPAVALATAAAEQYPQQAGSGRYRVLYHYTGADWWHARVQAIPLQTERPIAVLPQQYTSNGKQPGAFVGTRHVGRLWNEITQAELAQRLQALGFEVLTPSIQMYGESLEGFQGLEHFIAGVAKGNRDVQVLLLTADAHDPNAANMRPGAQMLVSALHPRDAAWEARIQQRIAPFYTRVGLGNLGPRSRGGQSMEEGSSKAWHPLIERAAEYSAQVAIMEVARAIDIEQAAGSMEAGRVWARELFDAVALAMADHACSRGFVIPHCRSGAKTSTGANTP